MAQNIQATFDSIKDKIYKATADGVEEKFEDIASYVIYQAVPDQSIDTGAYVTSFSIGPAGFSGGRSRSSDNKPKGQNPSVMKDQGFAQLQYDIQSINFEDLLESGNTRFTIRNRSPHALDVENGWRDRPRLPDKDGYHVFTKIRSRFG
jgi:hypothetical protein|tara:strand:- start:5 stop:451 length:447 start_codon:yes stop_codon:yes gene_type:complete